MFAAGVLGSFVLYLVVGAMVGRKVKTRSDFYVAGRKAPTVLVAGTLVASFLSTVSFMGELGFSYDGFPIVMLILTAINICGYVVGVLAFGRYLRRSRALTVPEFFGRRFDSRALQGVAGIMVVVGIGLYLVAVTQGLSLVVAQLLDVPELVALVTVWLAYTVFILMSGTKGVMVNDTIMFFVFMVAGVVGMSWIIGKAGGPGDAVRAMLAVGSKPDALTWHGATGTGAVLGSPSEALVYAITLGIVWATVVAVSPWQSSRYLMAKNEHVCLRSGFVAMASVGVLYIFLTLGGFAINIFNPQIAPSEIAFIWAAQNILPTALGVLVVTGIVAAGLSSAAGFLALIGFSAAHDVLPWLLRQDADAVDDAAALRTSRLVMLGAGGVVLLVTWWSPPAVLTIGYFAATLFAAAWGPVAIWCIRSPRLSARGAMTGMLAGFTVVAVLNGLVEFAGVELAVWADPVILGFAASIVATWLGGRGAEVSPAGVEFRRALMGTPESDRDPRDLSTTRTVALGTAAVFAVVIMTLLFVYAVPMSDQVAIGP